jgi:hypothetical protein
MPMLRTMSAPVTAESIFICQLRLTLRRRDAQSKRITSKRRRVLPVDEFGPHHARRRLVEIGLRKKLAMKGWQQTKQRRTAEELEA